MRDLRSIAQYMLRHGLLAVTAESCTAGLIASRLAGRETRRFDGDRNRIRAAAADFALQRIPELGGD